jgi:hypothetical protein
MSGGADCDCNDPTKPKKPGAVPCSPCAQAARAIASATPAHTFHGVGAAATSDLTTIQTFLASLTPNTPPTQADLTAAQQAATDLSTQVFSPPASATPAAGSTTLPTTYLVLGGLAIALGGASIAYLYKSPKRRRR